MSSLTLRRSLVILATIASLFGGAAAIHAAAGWTASVAPLTAPPNPVVLVAKLRSEKARAEAISQELSQVVSKAAELRDALRVAQEKAATTAAAAAVLSAKLAAAQQRLATLESQLATHRSPGAGAAANPPVPATPSGEVERDD